MVARSAPLISISARPSQVATGLVYIALVLLACNFLVMIGKYGFGHERLLGLRPLFHFDQEANAPTLFSSILLLMNSGLAGINGYGNYLKGQRHRAWFFLAFVLLFLSLDEIASIHEMLINPVRTALDTGGALYYAWVIPYGILVMILAVVYLPVLFRLPADLRNWLLLAATVYVSGAIGLEMVGGAIADGITASQTLWYELTVTAEESLEMAGLIIAVYALMSLIQREHGGLRFETHAG